jgi:hypothetical protein
MWCKNLKPGMALNNATKKDVERLERTQSRISRSEGIFTGVPKCLLLIQSDGGQSKHMYKYWISPIGVNKAPVRASLCHNNASSSKVRNILPRHKCSISPNTRHIVPKRQQYALRVLSMFAVIRQKDTSSEGPNAMAHEHTLPLVDVHPRWRHSRVFQRHLNTVEDEFEIAAD